jgi:hypothetical protein
VFFWIFLAVMAIVFVGAFSWGARGIGKRWHEPGTTHLAPPGPHDR